MNIEWETFATVVTAVGGLDFVKWLYNRHSSARKAKADAATAIATAKDAETRTDTDKFSELRDLTVFLQTQLNEIAKSNAGLWEENRELRQRLFEATHPTETTKDITNGKH